LTAAGGRRGEDARLVGQGDSASVALPATEARLREALPLLRYSPSSVEHRGSPLLVPVCVRASGSVVGAGRGVGVCRPPLPSHETFFSLPSAPQRRVRHSPRDSGSTSPSQARGERQGDTKEPLPEASSIRDSSELGCQVQGTLSTAGRVPGRSQGNGSTNPGPRSPAAATHFHFTFCGSERSPGPGRLGSWPQGQQAAHPEVGDKGPAGPRHPF